MGIAAAGAATAAAAIGSSIISSGASKSAANTQAAAAKDAANATLQMYQQTQQYLSPYRALGQSSAGQLGYLLGLPGFENPTNPAAFGAAANSPAGYTGGAAPPQSSGWNTSGDVQSQNVNGLGVPSGAGAPITDPSQIKLAPGQHIILEGTQPDGTATGPQVVDTQGNIIQQFGIGTTLDRVNAVMNPGNSAGGTSMPGGNGPPPAAPPGAGGGYGSLMGAGAPTWDPTISGLEKTPGYQFTLDQGMKATANQNAAMGLGGSGAEAKGVQQYAQGLASTTYGQNFNIYNQQYANYWSALMNKYNMLSGQTALGAAAAGGTGQQGANAQGAANAANIGGANASAAGTVGAANAAGAGLSGIAGAGNTALNYSLLKSGGMFGNQNSGSNGPIDDGSFA